MPGYPLGGHGLTAHTSQGSWLRLYSRAIYLQDGNNQRLALVSADLWSVPAGLGDRVAELVVKGDKKCFVKREQIVLAATHTHQSPGNFSSSKLYNNFASPVPGFDPLLFEFLAKRIAKSIQNACDKPPKARIAFDESLVHHLVRNRSLEPFLKNGEKNEILASAEDFPIGPLTEDFKNRMAYQAIYPNLQVLRFETDSGELIAIASFFAVHPTAMSHSTRVYSSDLFGAAAIEAEQYLETLPHNSKPVVAIFNGAQGDLSPWWKQQDRRNTIKLGKTLKDGILNIYEHGTPSEIDKDIKLTRYTIMELPNTCITMDDGERACTADLPMGGVAMIGGAEDGKTPFYNEGVVRDPDLPEYENQGVKQPALGHFINSLMLKKHSVPRKVPLGLYQLGDIVLATLPGEFTFVMGRRIKKSIQKILPESKHVILIGLANEYVSYIATPEEYKLQHYEGASTLYGPASGPAIKRELEKLAEGDPGDIQQREFEYSAGPETAFSLNDISEFLPQPGYGLDNILQNLDTGQAVSNYPKFCWEDAPLSLPNPPFPDEPNRPHVIMETRKNGGWDALEINKIKETDEGTRFVTIAYEGTEDGSKWCTYWMPPPLALHPDEAYPDKANTDDTFRFKVKISKGEVCSSEFQIYDSGTVSPATQTEETVARPGQPQMTRQPC